jgi:hypothetical protein
MWSSVFLALKLHSCHSFFSLFKCDYANMIAANNKDEEVLRQHLSVYCRDLAARLHRLQLLAAAEDPP